MHNNGLTYYRTQVPAAIETLEQVPAMVGREEKRCTYPMFLTRTDGLLLFRYRSGGSGNGRDYFNAYDESDRSWRRLFEEPFFDGEEKRSAYAHQPILGPDGRYHSSWVWRDTPDCSTNHDLGYARSSDLIEWETIDGRSIALPIRLDTPGIVVDPVPVEGGLLNGTGRVGFDSRGRPILAYYKYDPAGRSQAFVARHEGDAWRIRQVSDWDDRFELTGRGSLPTAHISLGAQGGFNESCVLCFMAWALVHLRQVLKCQAWKTQPGAFKLREIDHGAALATGQSLQTQRFGFQALQGDI
jgi:hypothetical protein